MRHWIEWERLHICLKLERKAIQYTSYIIKMSFERAVYGTTQVKRFPNLNIIKTLGKGYAIFNCMVYFTEKKALFLLLLLNTWNSCFHVLMGFMN